ncbi:MAG: hypothetical protein SFV18_13155 [Bryobacteraceae bacterium]|nr:hypothetical protein [Bryobacteraceae bacterium]
MKRAVLALALITVAFYWKLVLTNQYSWMESPDLAHQVLPWLQFQAGEWHKGRFPLWSPYEWGGQSLIGQAQPGAAYPPNWLLYLMPLKRGWMRVGVLHWYFVILHFLAAWFMFRLCRDRGASPGASILGGMVFAFGGYVGTVDWPQMLNGAIWAPLIFLFHLRAVEGKSPMVSATLSGLFLGLSWLSGHHQVPIFLTLAAGFSWLYFTWRDRSRFKYLLLFGVVFVLVSGLQTLPAWEYGRTARRWVGLEEPIGWNRPVPYHLHQYWGFQPISILGIIVPGLNQHTNAYIGLAAFGLVTLGWVRSGYFAILAVGGLLYSLAQFGVIEGLLYAVLPMVEKARSPSMAVIVFALGAAPLAAFGFDRIGETSPRLPRWLLIAGGGTLALYAIWAATKGLGAIPDQRPVMAALLTVTLSALLHYRPPYLRAAAGAIVFLELSLAAPYYWPNRFDPAPTPYLKYLSQNQEIVDFLRTQPQPVRVVVDDNLVKFNFGDWHGLDVYGGYLASISENLLDIDLQAPRTRHLMGVTHSIGKEPLYPDQPKVFSSASGLNVFEMPDPLPRAWVVHSTFGAEAKSDRLRLLQDKRFDLRQGAILDRELPLEDCGGDRVALLRHDPARVTLAADAACRGLLILGDTDAPGWRVTVDGEPKEPLTVNGAVRGVVLEKGFHRVTWEYRPNAVLAGGAMTALGALTVLGVLIMGRR